MNARTATITRHTRETDIAVEINLDGAGDASISTGLGFFDHMLTALARHSRIDMTISCRGDLEVDDHHTIEDVAIALGEAISKALGDGAGIRRFANAMAPLDEAVSSAVLDVSGRGGAWIDLGLRGETLGGVRCENLEHFFRSFASSMRVTLHVDVLRGGNDHHKAESAFKAVALALRDALRIEGGGVPSTKGVLR